ncbi:uncharacterized protein LOC132193367 [Neocloeon triangulifer]|uniref:uncharacterized protein LOC132193367 n=1 Tax=Neocloeon triangulifer TaxID=2078957 RepID=UPI00286F8134|nr:uncharacterized protein LOC132193367 [Neocloeon triangulifer]
MQAQANNAGAPVLKTSGCEEIDEILQGEEVPTLAYLTTLSKPRLVQLLMANGFRVDLKWDKNYMATMFREFLLRAERSVQPSILHCMRCHMEEATYIFKNCRHLGVCGGCREVILDMDMAHVGEARRAFCPVPGCHSKHISTDIQPVRPVH